MNRPLRAGAIARSLLRWYDRWRRDLPWRRDPTPYKTLVSELMLQQTVVATVEPYFARFMARFPDVRTLAEAREDEVLALWSGLGYYTRARNLHRAAKLIVQKHDGEVPSGEEALRALPGVGPYTAAAVASIAFGARTFALDGNAARVMARLHGVVEALDTSGVRGRLSAHGQVEVPARRAGDFNQAVMELGALVCVPRRPRCADCPLRADCVALARGLAATIPAKRPRPTRAKMRVVCAYVTRAGRVLLERRPPGRLLGGTWTLPFMDSPGRKLLGQVRHVFTHRDLTADIYAVPAGRSRAADSDDCRWVDPGRLSELGVSSFTRKTLRAAQKRDKVADRP